MNGDSVMEFNEKLKELRTSRGFTQEELAEALFVSRTAISKWESGRGYPSIDSLKEISGFFSVTIDELLSGEKLLSIAEKENRSNMQNLCRILIGVVDLFYFLLIVLPLYPKSMGQYIASVNLFSYTETTDLVDFCRANNLPVSGNKMELTERIACFLATGEIVAASVKSVRNANVGEITENTVIESDIVCSQKHRAFFREKIGKRIALSNAEIMIHQPAIHGNGINGQVTDIKIVSDQLQKSKQRLNRILAENTGKTIEEIRRDTERDNFMTATEALQYGLIDQVIEKR